jgi:acetolactate synthase-1/2/3 large subunit
MNVQELETAVRLKTPTVNMVWSDGTLGLIEWKQQNKFGRAYGTRFENPDWVQMAKSFGAVGIKVEKGENLQDVLRKAFSYDQPVVIDCPVDYTENIRLTKRLGQLVCPI